MQGKSTSQRTLAPLSFLFSLAILYYKRPDAFSHAQFWGEEGSVFFSDAYHHGFKSVFNTCTGYFHFYPRLIFCLAIILHLPMSIMPFVASYSWLFMFALVLFYVWKRIQLEPLKKFFIAISIALIPIQAEVLMNLTNVQWIMAIFPFIIFTNPSPSRQWLWLDSIVLFMTGFTGPNLVIFIPLLLFLVLTKKINFSEKRIRPLVVIICLSVFATIISLISFGSVDRTAGTFDPSNTAFVNYFYVQYALLFTGKFAFDTPMPVIYTVVVLILAFIIYFSARILKGQEKNSFTIVTFFGSIIFLVITIISYRHDPSTLHPHYGAARNFFLPALFCTWYILSFLKFNPRNNIIASVFMLLLFYDTFRLLRRERFVERTWSSYSPKIKTTDTLSIPINPPGWRIFIDNRTK